MNATFQFMRTDEQQRLEHISVLVKHLSNLLPSQEQLKGTGPNLEILDRDFPGWNQKITFSCARLLHLLYIHAGKLVLKTLIHESLRMEHSSQGLGVMVHHLRKFLRATRPDITIETVFGTGYRLNVGATTELSKFTDNSHSLSYLDVTLASGKLIVQHKKLLPIPLLRYKILAYLLLRRMRLVPNAEILEFFYGPESTYEKRTLDVHISRIRALLKDTHVGITCVHNVGYIVSAKDDWVTINRIKEEMCVNKTGSGI